MQKCQLTKLVTNCHSKEIPDQKPKDKTDPRQLSNWRVRKVPNIGCKTKMIEKNIMCDKHELLTWHLAAMLSKKTKKVPKTKTIWEKETEPTNPKVTKYVEITGVELMSVWKDNVTSEGQHRQQHKDIRVGKHKDNITSKGQVRQLQQDSSGKSKRQTLLNRTSQRGWIQGWSVKALQVTTRLKRKDKYKTYSRKREIVRD